MIDDRTGSSKLALCLFFGRLCITDNSHYMQIVRGGNAGEDCSIPSYYDRIIQTSAKTVSAAADDATRFLNQLRSVSGMSFTCLLLHRASLDACLTISSFFFSSPPPPLPPSPHNDRRYPS